ncbi:MAG: UDP-N-acetylmuramate dehydrogenase [Firmicutes bacterium]|nr:UDP-N-acetylmuramate dehydrogenase [Candidatus Colimorpha enterica]
MTDRSGLEDYLSSRNIKYRTDEPLSAHCSFRIGGQADFFALPADTEELEALVSFCRENLIRYRLVGRGTNLLFDDAGFRGLIISLSLLDTVRREGNEIVALCGAQLSKVCLLASNEGLSGIEKLFGIPGSVGGAVYMNAGAYGSEIKDVCTSVTVLDGEGNTVTLSNADCDFSYRRSVFTGSGNVILSARFALTPGDPAVIRSEMDEIIAKRVEKQPLDLPSAGSAFKRPEGSYASKLIDECGLKGLTVGGAQVSPKHAGFIVNIGGATSSDVRALSALVAEKVYAETGYLLTPEPEYVEP